MKNEVITTEYALEKLNDALKEGDLDDVKKWDFIIRSNNEYRIKVKEKIRQAKDDYLRLKLRQMYRL